MTIVVNGWKRIKRAILTAADNTLFIVLGGIRLNILHELSAHEILIMFLKRLSFGSKECTEEL